MALAESHAQNALEAKSASETSAACHKRILHSHVGCNFLRIIVASLVFLQHEAVVYWTWFWCHVQRLKMRRTTWQPPPMLWRQCKTMHRALVSSIFWWKKHPVLSFLFIIFMFVQLKRCFVCTRVWGRLVKVSKTLVPCTVFPTCLATMSVLGSHLSCSVVRWPWWRTRLKRRWKQKLPPSAQHLGSSVLKAVLLSYVSHWSWGGIHWKPCGSGHKCPDGCPEQRQGPNIPTSISKDHQGSRPAKRL